mmetsp:Transcript_36353/g.96074  ORF Transcript_36353/g.96074 Transcript_36353/m.96074 type:complete len:221 (+) Transcript_36353:337-999(+)
MWAGCNAGACIAAKPARRGRETNGAAGAIGVALRAQGSIMWVDEADAAGGEGWIERARPRQCKSGCKGRLGGDEGPLGAQGGAPERNEGCRSTSSDQAVATVPICKCGAKRIRKSVCARTKRRKWRRRGGRMWGRRAGWRCMRRGGGWMRRTAQVCGRGGTRRGAPGALNSANSAESASIGWRGSARESTWPDCATDAIFVLFCFSSGQRFRGLQFEDGL